MSEEDPKKDGDGSVEDPKKAHNGSVEEPNKADDGSVGSEKPKKPSFLDPVFGEGYNVIEVRFTIFAAILIAINNGFVNGVTMSGLLSDDTKDKMKPTHKFKTHV